MRLNIAPLMLNVRLSLNLFFSVCDPPTLNINDATLNRMRKKHYLYMATIMSWISYVRSNITTSFVRSYFKSSLSSRRIVAHLPLRLGVDEAATAAVRLGGAGSSHTRRAGAVTTKFSPEAEEDGGQEEASHGCPGESHEVTADVGFRAGRAEGVAALDNPYAVCCWYFVKD